MSKRYALIDNGIVINIITSETDPVFMTDLVCIEVDESIYAGCIYNNGEFIKVDISENNTSTLQV